MRNDCRGAVGGPICEENESRGRGLDVNDCGAHALYIECACQNDA